MAKPLLTVTLDSVGGLPVVRAAGELDLGTASAMRLAVAGIVEAQPQSVLIIDLREVTFMDGSGLTVLIGAQNRLRRCRGEVVLITEQPIVLTVLKLSRADRILLVYPNEEAFLATRKRQKSRCTGPHPHD